MAIYEKNGVLNYIDESGNKYLLYPVTTADNVDGLDEELANKVNVTDIINNLTSTDTSKPLSAKQGKELKSLIDGKTMTVDQAMSSTSTNAIANKVVKSYIDTADNEKVNITDIVNNLTSTSTNVPLSAYQGKVLNTAIGEKQAKPITRSNISVSVTPTALSAYNSWDTEKKYGYSATVTVSGLATTSLILNIVMTDTLLDSVAPIVTTGANSLTFYTEDATALSGTIYTLIAMGVS